MLYAKEMGHVMIVDDDDFVSRRLTSFVSKHPLANGWYVQNGYVWSDGGSWLYLYDSNFSRICGTSHIVRSDLYNIPASLESADDAYLGKMLGSHIFIQEHLQATHKPLAPLPFIGAVYRTGHPESHSRANGIFRQYFLHKWLLKHPITLFKRLSRLRIKGKVLNKEFFGR